MPKPTDMSVTDVPCTCHYLERAADDPRSPIVYDAQLNEYNLEYRVPRADGRREEGGFRRIYHCPFCGGAAPESKRGLLFAVIPPEEARRLFELLGGIKTLDEALQVFGPPDEDNPDGLTDAHPEREGKAPTVEKMRMLRYLGLSKTANVGIAESRTGAIHCWLEGKYLGPRPDR